MSTQRLPRTLVEAVRYFSDEDVCVQFVAGLRWENGPVCPRCDSGAHYYLASRRVWKCRDCAKQYSVKVGTMFEDSPIPLDKWLASIWLIANAKNGISSHELGRSVGLTQKSAWFVLHRIRLAMQTGSFDKFDGTVEVDETFIGGLARNMHPGERKRKIKGTGFAGKTIVAGARQRGGEVRAAVVPDTRTATLHSYIKDNVEPGATVYTDALASYRKLGDHYDHATVDHAERYLDGQVHTNGMENFWSLLKRGLKGTYVSVEPFHLFRYLDERMFPFNQRDLTDLGRFSLVLSMAAGKRLAYGQLTGKG